MPRLLSNPRLFYASVFALCAGLVSFGLYLQHVKGMEPCPLCILQRAIFVAIGIVALLAALFGAKRPGARLATGLSVSLLGLAGAGVATRQSWIQRFPPPIQECGADFYFLVDTTPLAQLLPALFSGTGDCAKRDWLLLNLSIADWALLCFVVITALALWRTLFVATR